MGTSPTLYKAGKSANFKMKKIWGHLPPPHIELENLQIVNFKIEITIECIFKCVFNNGSLHCKNEAVFTACIYITVNVFGFCASLSQL